MFKINQGKLNITQGRLKVGFEIPTPQDYGVFANFDASDVSNVSIIGVDDVNVWLDKSGNNRGIIKNYPTYPKYNVNQINGRATIKTNNTFFFNTASYWGLKGDITIMTVAKMKTLTQTQCILDRGDGPSDISPFNTLFGVYTTTNGKLSTFHEYGNGVNQDWESDIVVDDPSDSIISLRRDTAAKNWEYNLYNASQEETDSASYTNNPDGGSSTEFNVGVTSQNTGIWRFQGDIGQILIWDRRLTDVEFGYMKLFLKDHWGF